MKKCFKAYLQFFKFPKILLTAVLTYFIWTLFQYLPHTYLIAAASIISLVLTMKITKRLDKQFKSEKHYLFLGAFHGVVYSFNSIGLFGLIGVVSSMFFSQTQSDISTAGTIVISLFVAMSFLFNYGSAYIISEICLLYTSPSPRD